MPGYVFPPRRITVNLAPADLRKAGASLDLAIAMGILLGSEQVRPAAGRIAMIGELSLGGEVRSVPGVLPMVAALARRGDPASDRRRRAPWTRPGSSRGWRSMASTRWRTPSTHIRVAPGTTAAVGPPRVELVERPSGARR